MRSVIKDFRAGYLCGESRTPGNNKDSHIVKKRIGVEASNKEEPLSRTSGKDIGLKACRESKQGQECVVCSSKFGILLQPHRNSGRYLTNEFEVGYGRKGVI